MSNTTRLEETMPWSSGRGLEVLKNEAELLVKKTTPDTDEEYHIYGERAKPKPLKYKIIAVAFYWVISISLAFLKKTMMTGDYLKLDAPWFLSWTQFIVTVLCWTLMAQLGKHITLLSFFPQLEFDFSKARKIFPLTIVFLGMVVCNNLCIKYVEVSFYYVARALTIIFSILFTHHILQKRTSNKAVCCCMTLIAGWLLGMHWEVHLSAVGAALGVGASIFVALNAIYTKKMLISVTNESSELLMLYNNINSAILLPLIAWFITSEPSVLSQQHSWEVMATSTFWIMVTLTGVLGFLVGYASYLQIQYTSPLTHSISCTTKAAFQTLLALWIYGNPTNVPNLVSVAIVLLGSFAYVLVK